MTFPCGGGLRSSVLRSRQGLSWRGSWTSGTAPSDGELLEGTLLCGCGLLLTFNNS